MAIALTLTACIAVRIWAEVAYRRFVKRQPPAMQARLAQMDTPHF
jgi:hypothetical protein